jgi:hydrogenase nickel incorporation protein HypA/HybF
MHELSIAQAILDIALDHAGDRRVTQVDVRIGHLRQVVPDALMFAFQLVCDETPAEGARLDVTHVPAAGRCRACAAETELDGFPLRCGACGGLELDLLRGEELLVDALELEEPMTTTGGTSHGR